MLFAAVPFYLRSRKISAPLPRSTAKEHQNCAQNIMSMLQLQELSAE